MEPEIAQKSPYVVDLESGKDYFWCACGQSKRQPFCDGSHKVTEFKPLRFSANETARAWLCGCKRSKNPPFCDGTHKNT